MDRERSAEEIANLAGVDLVEAMRALQYLSNKGVVRLAPREETRHVLTERGKEYLSRPLPERRLLDLLSSGPRSLKDLAKDMGEELSAALGVLRSFGLVVVEGGVARLTEKAEGFVFPWEGKLDRLEDLDPRWLEALRKRGLVALEKRTVWYASPTGIWQDVVNALPERVIDRLTPEILRSGEWKSVPLRAYDVTSPVPRVYPGKRHPYVEFLHRVRLKMTAMGFKEMERADIVMPSFYNSEILFMPQDHPASEIGAGDIFVLAGPKKYGSVDKEIYERVREMHEKTWGYAWSDESAKRLVLRSHATPLSALTLLRGAEVPGRYFTISRVFRPDKIDARHLMEFNQLDGIVLSEDITFRNLLGVLRDFAREFAGTDRVRFMPSYFPFTEPSVEMYVKHPDLGWMEVGGAGMFREELLEPLNVHVPVVAWGLGIDRFFMVAMGISDIRMLFTRDLQWLRDAPKVWVV